MIARASAAVLAALACTGCLSISVTKMDGAELRYPVSLSSSLIDADGVVHRPLDSHKLASFEHSWGHWGMVYDSISLSSDEDLSALINAEVERVGGDGVVNLRVGAKGTGLAWLTSLLIVFPERVKVTVSGDVVRLADG